ncbi:hypothetical protein CGCSCA4_v005133 [Colletotrichum siamense]|uniref:ToxB-like N-terminal ascomycota domain-containing protein n=1 Tax=Colletotrichum siamense TaxID=690259 RepID=A0A9P5K6V2_COLSI|nr:uncharacterized protein CGCS363_v010392 [Colletotrichum siamense]KAF4847873.1 hypothetical protein CGCSCA4_v005133 [Colletotrichum siamense]KAF4861197.1 hypothetical protein CGCSCA2_v004595 [Colletotrichum siamense]KAF5491499.1 hypothetical protein CGCS363_v010392 [Colletotrichum siamense]
MRVTELVILSACFAGVTMAQDTGCQIELLNINQQVVDSVCIPHDGVRSMRDATAPKGVINYAVKVNSSCGAGLAAGNLANGASLRNAGPCTPS